jgi:hypothetical protein
MVRGGLLGFEREVIYAQEQRNTNALGREASTRADH